MPPWDAVLVLSFGGPEGPADVLPFLENVTRGRNVPPERLREVARHYEAFGGVSPLNAQNRTLVRALTAELAAHGPRLPVYLGNRNWHPLVTDTVRRMKADGVRRALAFVTSAFSSYSGCRQYREDLARARAAAGPGAPEIAKLRVYYDHPGFVGANAEHLRATLDGLPAGRRRAAGVVFTAHSIPVTMARACDYEAQLGEASRLVAEAAGVRSWSLAYQSRSGPPAVPWLEPDILTVVAEAAAGTRDLVVLPIGFVSDHLEVRHDLDVEAVAKARALGLRLTRAPTVGTAPAFVGMIRELIRERTEPDAGRRALGRYGPRPDECPDDCCRPGVAAGQPAPSSAAARR
jgi:ferrochelatase